MIYFCTPDSGRPSGGVRAIYRAVDLLNDAGVEAAVLHARPRFRCDWFDHSTQIVHPPVLVDGCDILVVPEAFTPSEVARLAPGVPKVVFNQNAYRTFGAATRRHGSVVATAMDDPDVVAVLVVSEDNRSLLEGALSGVRLFRMHHWIDDAVFHPGTGQRKRRIVAMPRKRPTDFRLLLDLLHARGALPSDWEIRSLEGRSEAEVAAELHDAALFVALGREEGFGLPVAEALSSGCMVVGFDGMGGRELFVCDAAVPIEDGDVGALASWIEGFISGYDVSRDEWRRRGDEAVAFIRSTYSRARSTSDLLACFGAIDGRAETRTDQLSSRRLPHRSPVDRARNRLLAFGRRHVGQP